MKGLSYRSPKQSRMLWCRPAHIPPWALSTDGAIYRTLLISHNIPQYPRTTKECYVRDKQDWLSRTTNRNTENMGPDAVTQTG